MPAEADFAQLAGIVAEVGRVATIAVENTELTKARIERLEEVVAGVVDAVTQLHGVLAELARARRF